MWVWHVKMVRCVLTALQKKPQPGQHWCFTMPLRWSSHKTSSWTELDGRIISCFNMAPWQRVSCPSMLSVAMHFLSARVRISRLFGVSMRQLHNGSSWASSIADAKDSKREMQVLWTFISRWFFSLNPSIFAVMSVTVAVKCSVDFKKIIIMTYGLRTFVENLGDAKYWEWGIFILTFVLWGHWQLFAFTEVDWLSWKDLCVFPSLTYVCMSSGMTLIHGLWVWRQKSTVSKCRVKSKWRTLNKQLLKLLIDHQSL